MAEYNKLVIFDLDGVIIDSREMHFHALNKALRLVDQKYEISVEEHLALYDGLPTTKKLEMLHVNKGLPRNVFDFIWREKQFATQNLLNDLEKDNGLIEICSWLAKNGYKMAIASNAIRDTVTIVVCKLGLSPFIDVIKTNQDVSKPKPYPEMYWQCMKECNAIPKTTIIIEDSHIGRQGALDSGATLLPVESRKDLTLVKVKDILAEIDGKKKNVSIPWRDSKLNVLIPMAGLGSRFAKAGYTFPKPLIDVNGKPMIQAVVENLNIEANYIFIVQREHFEKYSVEHMLRLIQPMGKVVILNGITDGAARTTLYAAKYIDNDNPLLLANSDQIVDWNSNEVMYTFKADKIDGGILTFKSVHPKWSYAKLDKDGFVAEVAEKKPISDNATVGIYYWAKGSDYVKYANQMINKDIRTNNEFYVAPVFNEAIADGKKIRIKEVAGMHGIGTPEDLKAYLEYVGRTNK